MLKIGRKDLHSCGEVLPSFEEYDLVSLITTVLTSQDSLELERDRQSFKGFIFLISFLLKLI